MLHRFFWAVLLCTWALPCPAAELAVLTDGNWDRLAPAGKEADCILGDFAFRSDLIRAVVARPVATRNANMTVRQVGGCLIDLTTTVEPNDQLSAYYPHQRKYAFTKAEIVQGQGRKVVLRVEAPADPAKKTPVVRVEYELEDGKPYLVIRTTFANPTDQVCEASCADDMRMDNVETRVKAGETDLFWVHDRHFEQAYGLIVDGATMNTRSTISQSALTFHPGASKTPAVQLAPGTSATLVRRIFPGRDLIRVKGEVARFLGQPVAEQGWRLVDPDYRPVVGAEVTLKEGGDVYATGKTDAEGWVKAPVPLREFSLECRSIGRPAVKVAADLSGRKGGDVVHTQVLMAKGSQVVAEVTDEKGGPIPCKVAFVGVDGTESPYWGPPAARGGVVNLYYSADGKFTVPIHPGSYEAIVSYGTEHDVVRVPLKVGKGESVPLQAKLRRAYETPGWVSADFHSHSSPSGDNTADQRGRVLNLVCEQIDFAPCTEHNRVDSYAPHLKALKVEHLLGTCPGIELTGSPLPLNHQNAFPLEMKPRTQDNGAPTPDAAPEVQIRRLAEWGDPKAGRLVQQNHPDIGWLFFDKNGDGEPDEGHRAGFGYMDVIEVHPIHEILALQPDVGTVQAGKRTRRNNTIFNWLQLLNLGYRIPGVVNTDAHYNYHGSGGLRNFVRCDTPVPGDIDPLDIVRHAEKGHVVMSNGPFLTVRLGDAIPGDDVQLKGGRGKVAVEVFCPDWFDIDRVQVLLNGRPAEKLNFTRSGQPELFGRGAKKFAHAIDLDLKEDAHVIVVAVGEKSELGDVMGPMWGRQNPVAISNPIYADVDGNGFQPNRDALGQPLPVKGGQ